MQLNSLVTNFRETCPQCEQPISVEKGKVTTCLVCNASQVHSDPGPGEIWRRCPVCHIFSRRHLSNLFPVHTASGIVIFQRTMVLISGYQMLHFRKSIRIEVSQARSPSQPTTLADQFSNYSLPGGNPTTLRLNDFL